MTNCGQNRSVPIAAQLFAGTLAGVACYLIAESLTPQQAASPGEHDHLLAQRLGIVYAPVIGVWLAWIQRSWARAGWSAVIGGLIGCLYAWLCSRAHILAVEVGFPCLMGGLLAALLGSNRSPWLVEIALRLFKGLAAGFVLGVVYTVVLNIAALAFLPIGFEEPLTERYIAMMWRAGPIALGCAGGLFMVLIQWSVGLSRFRIVTVEPEEPRATDCGQSYNSK